MHRTGLIMRGVRISWRWESPAAIAKTGMIVSAWSVPAWVSAVIGAYLVSWETRERP